MEATFKSLEENDDASIIAAELTECSGQFLISILRAIAANLVRISGPSDCTCNTCRAITLLTSEEDGEVETEVLPKACH